MTESENALLIDDEAIKVGQVKMSEDTVFMSLGNCSVPAY